MGERRVVGPVLEGRPADGVVQARRAAAEEHVLQHRRAAVGGVVIRAVDQRLLDAELVPRLPAVRAAAQELEGHHVDVGVHEAARLGVGGGALARQALGAELDLGELRAAGRGHEGEDVGAAEAQRAARGGQPAIARGGQPQPERARARLLDRPVGQLADRGGRLDAVLRRARQVVALAPVEHVLAERGGLEVEALGGGRGAAPTCCSRRPPSSRSRRRASARSSRWRACNRSLVDAASAPGAASRATARTSPMTRRMCPR